MKVTVLCHNLSTNNAMRAHRLAVTGHALDERRQPGGIGPRGARVHQDAALVAEVEVEPLAAEIESCM